MTNFRSRPGLRGRVGVSPNVPPPPEPKKREGNSKEIRTKIVGMTFTEKNAEGTPKAISFIKRIAPYGEGLWKGSSARYQMVLEEEPNNQYDADAVAVYAVSIDSEKRLRLGYISNAERICLICGAEFEKVRKTSDAVTSCTECGGEVVRKGLATRIRERAKGIPVKEAFSVEIAWSAGGVTGGIDGKLWGCNLLIKEN